MTLPTPLLLSLQLTQDAALRYQLTLRLHLGRFALSATLHLPATRIEALDEAP